MLAMRASFFFVYLSRFLRSAERAVAGAAFRPVRRANHSRVYAIFIHVPKPLIRI